MNIKQYLRIKQAKRMVTYNFQDIPIEDLPDNEFATFPEYTSGYGKDNYIRKPDSNDLKQSIVDRIASPYFPGVHSGRAMLAGLVGGGGLGYLVSRWANNKFGLKNPTSAGGKFLRSLINIGGTGFGSVGGLIVGSILNQIYNDNRFRSGRLYEIDQQRKREGKPSIGTETF